MGKSDTNLGQHFICFCHSSQFVSADVPTVFSWLLTPWDTSQESNPRSGLTQAEVPQCQMESMDGSHPPSSLLLHQDFWHCNPIASYVCRLPALTFMHILCIFYVYFMYILCIFYVYFMHMCSTFVYIKNISDALTDPNSSSQNNVRQTTCGSSQT